MLIINTLNLFIYPITVEILIVLLLISNIKNINYMVELDDLRVLFQPHSMINNPVKIFKPQEEGHM